MALPLPKVALAIVVVLCALQLALALTNVDGLRSGATEALKDAIAVNAKDTSTSRRSARTLLAATNEQPGLRGVQTTQGLFARLTKRVNVQNDAMNGSSNGVADIGHTTSQAASSLASLDLDAISFDRLG
ncbi:MAG: hypothetical protein AAFX40_14130, partial [Cyanobacteria bacterium J06639_1]